MIFNKLKFSMKKCRSALFLIEMDTYGSGSGKISVADPDPPQNVMDPQHWAK
jgi:hypothetical protein